MLLVQYGNQLIYMKQMLNYRKKKLIHWILKCVQLVNIYIWLIFILIWSIILFLEFVIIRGEISHDKLDKGHDLPATHVKLEVIEEGAKGHVIDQVDFICTSTKYPCPFEYWLDTSHIKANTEYKLEAILADRVLPARKSTHKKHQTNAVETKSTQPATFKINPTVDTEINDFKIIVADVQ